MSKITATESIANIRRTIDATEANIDKMETELKELKRVNWANRQELRKAEQVPSSAFVVKEPSRLTPDRNPLMASKTNDKQVYRLNEVPEHPLAKKYGITERQARRAIQSRRLQYARPGGLIVLVASEDIENWILGSRSDAK